MSLFRSLLRIRVGDHTPALPLVDTLKILPGADGPVHRAGGDPQFLLDIVQKLKGIVRVPVHLIDKGKNRDMAHHAHLKKFARLCLHTLGSVYDHHRRIRRHQRPVGILREVLMPRRIQNIDTEPVIRKLQYRGSDGNSPLLLNLHPVGNRMSRRRLSLDAARQIDRSPVQQKLLGKGCLARVRVRNDRKCSSSVYFLRIISHVFILQPLFYSMDVSANAKLAASAAPKSILYYSITKPFTMYTGIHPLIFRRHLPC